MSAIVLTLKNPRIQRALPCIRRTIIRFASTSTASTNRSEGSIGDAFTSLSKSQIELPQRFADLKRGIIDTNGDAILDGWSRLLNHLETEAIPKVKELSSNSIPEVSFSSIAENGGHLPTEAQNLLRECGTIIIRGIVPEEQALRWKQSVQDYVAANPCTTGFPAGKIQVYELYWSKGQLEARSHTNMLLAQTALNRVWERKPEDRVVLSEPIAYCDRLRMRSPGDTSFNLGPHLDGGSLERWEDAEYRKCYTEILKGQWEDHNAFKIGPRLGAKVDMYNGPGGCSAFRSYQGWLSLSDCSPTNGTLRVMPDLKASTAYTLLRPFVSKVSGGWKLDSSSSIFYGAAMGAGQELLPEFHEHLNPVGFVSIPRVRPGDAVFWHCDVAHMVEEEHRGVRDASVFYIPVAPLCEVNAGYLKRQKENFLQQRPPPDFPGGVGESLHSGTGTVKDPSEAGLRSMGLAKFDSTLARTDGERTTYELANSMLDL